MVRHQTLLSPLCAEVIWAESKISFASVATCTLETKVALSGGMLAPLVHLGPPHFQSLRHRGPCVSRQLCPSKSALTFLSWVKPLPSPAGLPSTPCLPHEGSSLQHNPYATNLDLHRVLLGPVPVILLLALHELPEMLLDEESSIEFAHRHLIIWRGGNQPDDTAYRKALSCRRS